MKICTIDFETDPFAYGIVPEPFLCGFYDGAHYYKFWGARESILSDLVKFLEFFSTQFDDIVIYAHNGGRFDFVAFLLPLFDPEIFILGGRIVKCTALNKSIEFRDSYAIYPMPLKTYRKDALEIWKLDIAHRDEYRDEIISYNRTDCVALHEIVSAFIGRFGDVLTIGAAAFAEIKKTGYVIPRTGETYDKKFRQFYYGGRVEFFETGEVVCDKTYDFYDINSAYPHAMTYPHWYGSTYYTSSNLPQVDNGSWYAEIEAVSEGALPYRYKKIGEVPKLIFPIGERRTYLASGWEINNALKHDKLKIHRIISVYVPHQTKSFSDYVEKYIHEKNDGKSRWKIDNDNSAFIQYLFAKLLLNSGYGKFGQDARNFEEYIKMAVGEWPDDDRQTVHEPECRPGRCVKRCRKWRLHSDVNDYTFFRRSNPGDTFFNVATAASITAFVRAMLTDVLFRCDRPIYCDTDSICARGVNGIKIGDELGQWEREGDVDLAYVGGKKLYAFFGADGFVKAASKGVRFSANQIRAGIVDRSSVLYQRDAPSYGFDGSTKFLDRTIDFSKNLR